MIGVSREERESGRDKVVVIDEIRRIILELKFWQSVRMICNVMLFIYKLLRFFDCKFEVS